MHVMDWSTIEWRLFEMLLCTGYRSQWGHTDVKFWLATTAETAPGNATRDGRTSPDTIAMFWQIEQDRDPTNWWQLGQMIGVRKRVLNMCDIKITLDPTVLSKEPQAKRYGHTKNRNESNRKGQLFENKVHASTRMSVVERQFHRGLVGQVYF